MKVNLILLKLLISCVVVLTISSCGGNAGSAGEETAPDPQTPVTVTTVSNSALADSIELNATSVFLQQNFVKANAIGYIKQVNIKPGTFVQKGQLMFVIKTKEAQSIGNTINVLDTTFKFSGINYLRASRSGYVTALAHQVGDYVQDGEQLATISDRESFAFVLQLPYELRSVLGNNQNLLLTLPDGEKLNGHVASVMPSVDSLSQTKGIVIKVNSTHPLPDKLVAKALIIKAEKSSVPSLPKSAVLSNETQDEFWVMKLVNDSTAIKTSIKKGLESGGRVEIISPKFSNNDRIAISGNYSLADTAKVKVVKP